MFWETVTKHFILHKNVRRGIGESCDPHNQMKACLLLIAEKLVGCSSKFRFKCIYNFVISKWNRYSVPEASSTSN